MTLSCRCFLCLDCGEKLFESHRRSGGEIETSEISEEEAAERRADRGPGPFMCGMCGILLVAN